MWCDLSVARLKIGWASGPVVAVWSVGVKYE